MLINFTNHRGNEQTTAQLVAVRTALRLLEDDLERARDALLAAIASAAEGLGDFDYLFPDPEQPKDADWVSLYRRAIKALPEPP